MDTFNVEDSFRFPGVVPGLVPVPDVAPAADSATGAVGGQSAQQGSRRTAREEDGSAVDRLFEEWRALRAAVVQVCRKYPGSADDFAKVAYDYAAVCTSPEWKEFVA